MKKFTEKFLLEGYRFDHVLRKIGLGLVMVSWALLSFGQEPQETLEYYADGPTGACYNLSNNYEVQISFRDFILIDTFSLELTYDKTVFSYTDVVTDVHPDLGASNLVVTESPVSGSTTLNKLTMDWGNGSEPPVEIGDNVKTPVFKLGFSINGYPHSYDVMVPQFEFTSALTWNDDNSRFWNIVGGVQEPVTTKEPFNGTLTVTQQWQEVEVTSNPANCYGSETIATVTVPENVTGMEYSFNSMSEGSFTSNASTSVDAPSTNIVRVLLDGCVSFIKEFDVEAADPFSFSVDKVFEVNCPGGNAQIEIVATGGSSPYRYYVIKDVGDAWSDAQSAIDDPSVDPEVYLSQYMVDSTHYSMAVAQRPEGEYAVFVQDANNCMDWDWESNWLYVQVIDERTPWDITMDSDSVLCYGDANGQIVFSVQGGEPWSDGYNIYVNGVQIPGRGVQVSSGGDNESGFVFYDTTLPSNSMSLATGDYWIVIQDSLGCTKDTTVTIHQPDPIEFDVGHTDTGCNDDIGELWIETGSIVGGTLPLDDWVWKYSTDPSWTDAGAISNELSLDSVPDYLAAGVYYVRIKDAAGCWQDYESDAGDKAIKILTTEFELVVDPIKCKGDPFSAEIVFTSGTGDHEFEFRAFRYESEAWVAYTDWQTSPEFNDLENNESGGEQQETDWRFDVWDKTLDCVVSLYHTETPPEELDADILPWNSFPPSCPGNSDGSVVIWAMGGRPWHVNGVKVYEYKMDDEPWVQSSQYNSFSVDTANHIIHIKDSAGCTTTVEFDWDNTENYIQFQDTIKNCCPLDMVNLFNADPSNDYWYVVGLDMGYLEDFTWHGAVGTEHWDGPYTYGGYTFWTSDSGYVSRTLQGVQFQRNPKLYISDEYQNPEDIIAHGELVGHESAFGAGETGEKKYWLVAVDEWGCMSNVDSILIMDPPRLDVVDMEVKPAGCAGSTDGLVKLTAINGTGPIPETWYNPNPFDKRYQYVWTEQGQIFNDPNWLDQVTWKYFPHVSPLENDSLFVKNVKKGTYYMAVRDSCSIIHPELIWFSGPIEVGGAEPVELVSYDIGHITCNIWDPDLQEGVSDDNGHFTVTEITGGFGEEIGDYIYDLTGAGGEVNIEGDRTGHFSNLPAGDYTLTIEDDSLGCQLIHTFTIEEPDPLKLELDIVHASCYGAQDGIIRYIIEGGTEPYQESTNNGMNWYDIAKDPVGGVVQFDRQAGAGTYSVMIKDSRGCEYGPVEVVIEQPGQLGIYSDSTKVTDVSCASGQGTTGEVGTEEDGIIEVKLKGGWDTAGDNFEYIVTAKKGTTTIYGVHDDDDVAGWVTLSGLTAGDWLITVKEWNDGLYGGPYTTNPDYETAYASGFPSDYQNGRSTCIFETTITVGAPDPLEREVVYNPVKCHNEASGSIELYITGGTQPYSVKLEGPEGSDYAGAQPWVELEADATSKIWEELPHGHYNVFVKDDNDCTIPYESGEVNNADSLELQMIWISDATCHDGDGRIMIEAEGGTGTYEYAVVNNTYNFEEVVTDDLDWQVSEYFDVPAGVWIGFVRDIPNGCVQGWPTNSLGQVIQAHRVTVIEPPPVVGDATSGTTVETGKVDCYGEATGKIEVLDIDGGNGPTWKAHVMGYDFTGEAVDKWYDDVDPESSTKKWLGGLKASTDLTSDIPDSEKYSVVFYDKDLCASDTVKVAVMQPVEFDIELYVTQDAFICPEDLAGVFEIRILSGGVAPFQYRWEAWDTLTNTLVFDTDWGYINTFQGQAGLLYKVWARDDNDCVAFDEDFIEKPEPVIIDTKDITCYDDEMGSARVWATGTEGRSFKVLYKEVLNGVVDEDWTEYNGWFNDSIDVVEEFKYCNDELQCRHYLIAVMDTMGCMSEVDTMVFYPVQNELMVEATIEGNEITAVASGGAVDEEMNHHYQFALSVAGEEPNPVWQNENVFMVNEYNEYVVWVRDYNLCLANDTVTGGATPYSIAEIQGGVDSSLVSGEIVMTDGTVTGVVDGVGFYMQDANAAWSGIWVSVPEGPIDIAVGDGVVVMGEVAEIDHVTTIIAMGGDIIDPPLTVEPILLGSPSEAIDEKYESVLVKVGGARATAADEGSGQWIIYYETSDSVVVDKLMYTYVPTEGNYYDVTGVANGINDAFMMEPRMEEDVVDLTETTPAALNPENVEFKVYPNPFRNFIYIDNYDKLTRVVISDIAGKRVIDVEYPTREIRTDNLVSGVYVVSMFTEGGRAKAERIVKW